MKFALVVGGAFLLILGLLAYSMIPNFHIVPLESTQMVVSLKPIPVSSASLSETPENVTLFPGKENSLVVNMTVSTQTRAPSSILFRTLCVGGFQSSMRIAGQRGCLVTKSVSNSTIRVSLNASTTYYFGFNKRGSGSSEQRLLSAPLVGSS